MVEVYVFHHSHLLCLISFRNLARSFLNLIKFSVVGCFGFVKSLVAFFLRSLDFFVPPQGGVFFFFTIFVVFPWTGCFLRYCIND